MIEDREKWDKKHLENPLPTTPSDLLIEYIDTLNGGLALDIACGNGRNSKFLAENGFVCDSVDISNVALRDIENIKNINPICADLDSYVPKQNSYDLVVHFYFLDRRLFEPIKKSLKNGGKFILETFIKDKNGENSSNINDQKILNDGELENIFKDFKILHNKTSYILRREGQKAKIISFVAQK